VFGVGLGLGLGLGLVTVVVVLVARVGVCVVVFGCGIKACTRIIVISCPPLRCKATSLTKCRA